MLYNRKWDVQVKPDVFSLIAWLQTQSPIAYYDPCHHNQCLIFQWLKSVDAGMLPGDGHSFMYVVNGVNQNFERFSNLVFDGKRTFGAALDRARTLSRSPQETASE